MRDSKVFHFPHFSLRIGSLPEQKGASRFSFVVSKKIALRATKRNTLRRRGYRVVQKMIDSMVSGVVVLIFTKKGVEILTEELFYNELAEIFKKTGLSG